MHIHLTHMLADTTPSKTATSLTVVKTLLEPLREDVDAKAVAAVPPQLFALVRKCRVVNEAHPIMLVPMVSLMQEMDHKSYEVVPLSQICGHAHLVPDFDDLTGKNLFWDDIDNLTF